MYCLVMGFSSGYPSGQRVWWPRYLSEGNSSSTPYKDCCPQSGVQKTCLQSTPRPYWRLSLSDCGMWLPLTLATSTSIWRVLGLMMLYYHLSLQWVPCQLGGKSCGACLHDDSDNRTLLSIPWPLLMQSVGLPLLTLISVTWTCAVCYMLSWVWGQRSPKFLPWWLQETMKI